MTARRSRLSAAILLVLTLALAGCGSAAAISTISAVASQPLPLGATVVETPPSSGPSTPGCDPTASLKPGVMPKPGAMPAGTSLATIAARGRLIVGVDQNTYLFGFRNPRTGQLEGFDIEIARAIAKAIFGDPTKIDFRVLTSAQRIPALQDGSVDLVVRTFSITCARLQMIAFSSVYYQAQQRILVPSNSDIKDAANLGGKTVCATNGSTSLVHLLALDPKPKVLAVTDWSDCLVAIQQGQAAAMSTDDSILLGIQAQDPNLNLVGASLSPEPYGIGIKKGDAVLVRFVNGVLEQLRAGGGWTQIYHDSLSAALHTETVPAPPVAKYSDG